MPRTAFTHRAAPSLTLPKPMHLRLITRTFVLALAAAPVIAGAAEEKTDKPLHKYFSVEDKSSLSHAYQWLDIAQEATSRDVDRSAPRPTIISRTLAVWATAMYDAWAAYDEKAVGSRLGDKLRRPKAEHTLANKQKAIAYASYHSLLYVYGDKAWLDGEMKRIGFDPCVTSKDPATPEGVSDELIESIFAPLPADQEWKPLP